MRFGGLGGGGLQVKEKLVDIFIKKNDFLFDIIWPEEMECFIQPATNSFRAVFGRFFCLHGKEK